MKDLPIIFSGESVRAILAGTKTQTRRLLNPQPLGGIRTSPFAKSGYEDGHGYEVRVRYRHGRRLWIKEAWAPNPEEGQDASIIYRADGPEWDDNYENMVWASPMYMPKTYARIWLEITDVRVQQLQQITDSDAQAEGIVFVDYGQDRHGLQRHGWSSPEEAAKGDAYCLGTARFGYANLWDRIQARRKTGLTWQQNPWVYAITFRRVENAD